MIEQKGILEFMDSVHFMQRLLLPGTGIGSYGILVGEDEYAWITIFGDDPWIENCMYDWR